MTACRSGGVERLDPSLDRELDELARIANGADFAEGIDSFLAKRPPKFGSSSQDKDPARAPRRTPRR